MEQEFYAWMENCGAGGVRMDRRSQRHIRLIRMQDGCRVQCQWESPRQEQAISLYADGI